MPFGNVKPQCKYCNTESSPIWRRDSGNDYICQTCFIQQEAGRSDDSNGNNKSKSSSRLPKNSTRLKSVRNKVIMKGKNRRNIYKIKPTVKIESSGCTTSITDFLIHKEKYFQSGDVISVIDEEDRNTYYAQCNAFMTDEYGQKFVSYTWLLPIKTYNPNADFNPSMFYLGPDDELFRKIESVEFVCHAPADYYKPQRSLYPTFPISQTKNYVSVNMN